MLTSAALRGLLDATPSAIACFDATLRTVYANTAFTTMTGVQSGRPLEEETLVNAVREMVAGSSAPRRVRLGGPARMPVSGTLFPLADGMIGMVVDAGAHEALAVLAAEQSALRRVATLVAASPEPEQVFTAVAEEAGRLLHARSAATIRYEEGHAVTVGRWADDDLGGFEIGTSVPLAGSEGLTAIVAQTGAPARIEDYTNVRGRAAELMRERGYRSAVAAPIVARGRTWGLLLVASAGSLGADAEHRLAGFAELVALALESAEARAELNASRVRILEAGVTERRRLERNLHDGAQQRLVALAVQMRVLEKRLSDPERALLRAASDELALALDELRELARGLHPAILADRGLAPALETLASRAPLPVSVEGVPDTRLAEPLEAAVYFVVAESLTNAVKHAEASELQVRMTASNGELQVEIADDGRGGADPNQGGASGLRGLADRVEALGGTLALESPPGAGTVVRAVLPLQTAL
ncbi:MAG TPA: GAF domain-containing protein [Solirubrobacter sp.]|nr:GAF domain-containing protein [Solirubrobacter sp.]